MFTPTVSFRKIIAQFCEPTLVVSSLLEQVLEWSAACCGTDWWEKRERRKGEKRRRSKGRRKNSPWWVPGSLWFRLGKNYLPTSSGKESGQSSEKGWYIKLLKSYLRNSALTLQRLLLRAHFIFKKYFTDIDEWAVNAHPKFSWIKTIRKLACIIFYIIFRKNVAFRKYIKLMTYSQEYGKFPIYPAWVITSVWLAWTWAISTASKNEGNEAASSTKG